MGFFVLSCALHTPVGANLSLSSSSVRRLNRVVKVWSVSKKSVFAELPFRKVCGSKQQEIFFKIVFFLQLLEQCVINSGASE